MNKEVLPAERLEQGRLEFVPSEDGAALRALWQKQEASRRIRKIGLAFFALIFISAIILPVVNLLYAPRIFAQTAEISEESLYERPKSFAARNSKARLCSAACFIVGLLGIAFILSGMDKKKVSELFIPLIRRLFGGKDDDYISYYIFPGSNQAAYPEKFKKYSEGISEKGLATILSRCMQSDIPCDASYSESNVKMHFAGIFYRNVCKYWRVENWIVFDGRRQRNRMLRLLSVWNGDCFSIEYPKDDLNLRFSMRQKTERSGWELARKKAYDGKKLDVRTILMPKPFGVTFSDMLEGIDAPDASSASREGLGWLTEKFDITFSERPDAEKIFKVFDYELVGQFFKIADRFGGTLDIVTVDGGLLCFIDKSRSRFETPYIKCLSDFDSYVKITRKDVSDVREMCLVLETIVERMRALHL